VNLWPSKKAKSPRKRKRIGREWIREIIGEMKNQNKYKYSINVLTFSFLTAKKNVLQESCI